MITLYRKIMVVVYRYVNNKLYKFYEAEQQAKMKSKPIINIDPVYKYMNSYCDAFNIKLDDKRLVNEDSYEAWNYFMNTKK